MIPQPQGLQRIGRFALAIKLMDAGGQTNVAQQTSQLEDLVTQQVDGIIVSPMDGSAVLPALQKAKDAGIPVFLVDQPIAAGNEALYETLIATDNVKNLALLDVYGRVARLLLNMAVEIEDGKMRIPEKITQQEIAERVGASRDMVSRIFRDLTAGGYISVENRIITINKKPPARW